MKNGRGHAEFFEKGEENGERGGERVPDGVVKADDSSHHQWNHHQTNTKQV
jgi:hypothetical protein